MLPLKWPGYRQRFIGSSRLSFSSFPDCGCSSELPLHPGEPSIQNIRALKSSVRRISAGSPHTTVRGGSHFALLWNRSPV